MIRALDVWDRAGRKITLDAAAAQVSTDGAPVGDDVIPTVGAVNSEVPGMGSEHHELDQRIRAHQAEHGCTDYHCGLAAVTGISLGNGIAGTP